jgi:hypothetical protein
MEEYIDGGALNSRVGWTEAKRRKCAGLIIRVVHIGF